MYIDDVVIAAILTVVGTIAVGGYVLAARPEGKTPEQVKSPLIVLRIF